MAGTGQTELLKQISQSWEQAQRQLADLRTQVEQTTALAQAKVQLNFLERDLDRAYRDLGEAVWSQVQMGRMKLSPSLAHVQKALEQVQARIEEQNAGLRDLLAEGNEAAGRLKTKSKVAPKTAVAHGKTKR